MIDRLRPSLVDRVRALIVALVAVGLVAGPAVAAPRKVLVLPLDGTAPPATRTKLSASLQKMARVLDGEVQAGDATFVDTATAIGCDPTKPACVENVRATLGVDELVYGTADEHGGEITLVVTRYAKGKERREQTMQLATDEPASRVEVELLPVFSTEPMPDQAPDPVGPDTAGPTPDPNAPNAGTVPGSGTPVDPGPKESRRERNIAIAITAGGGVVLALGFALWSQAGNLQDDIDSHPRNTLADFQALEDLESQASSRAWAGNAFVLAGLVVAGYGGWRLYQDHKSHQHITVTPTPVEGGGGVTLTWGGW